MVNNLSFMDHEHFCRVCGKEIDMNRVKNMINAVFHNYIPKIKATDPFILEDHGNDLELGCSFECYKKYLNVD